MQSLQEKIRQVEQNFKNRVPEYINKIEQAIADQNRSLIKKSSHDFSGAAYTFGYHNLGRIASSVNETALTSPFTILTFHVKKMKSLHHQGKG